MKNRTSKEKHLLSLCDVQWAGIILARAGYRCEMCGSPKPSDTDDIIIIDPCHIIGKGSWSTRWELRNGIAGCRSCHVDYLIMAWLKENDFARYQWAITEKQKVVHHWDIDLEEVLEELRNAA